ncbi:aminotransferase class V-fold PLP-dependent enzyme [Microbacterium imperiale]|uniref:Cysteine desulfurase n=1 Tax=Microbacterium imperiale TaxID=33884 RepID=A0A9W6HHF9_9MICO|nr:aminotransferase class V-fold PLP-dependent enzyme [Microbacterium imperiale]MBP2420419.1 selenocysteine lyase/cysteine desulfurase [Microbacterium imperiale]MDS0197723.1 aminotransferase class V-fold PLP-dependent enzyme [Microbacterium imperiale]BFE40761.1 cysteine desulfurase SufS [Microbacterium imperiale]GLJ80094.1 putative cysteine desulfurase [Microbacterium imperiale]
MLGGRLRRRPDRQPPRPLPDAAGIRAAARRDGFAHVPVTRLAFDSACQTLRPQPVLDAVLAHDRDGGACGGRVQYEAGRRVDDEIAAVRRAVLDAFALSSRRYACAFTANTTAGLNALLHQLPPGRFARVITTHTEHNAVFLSTMTFARRAGIPRLVVDRASDGSPVIGDTDLSDALLVVSAMDNVDGTFTSGLAELVERAHRRGGVVIVDAAQAAPHALSRLRGVGADAFCFSAHKMYGPTLGLVVATSALLDALEPMFLGGGQVARVGEDDYELLPDLHTRLEPGSLPGSAIIGFGAALRWFVPQLPAIEADERALAERLAAGLERMPNLTVESPAPSAVMSVRPHRVDAHRLAVFLSRAGVEVRSGHFCAHHWLAGRRGLPPLVRFSLGAHNTPDDVDAALAVLEPMLRGL